MNREEFMNELAFLLQDISEEEKDEVLQYYNDYFEEGGEAQEAKIIRELESPEKVAAIIKDGLGMDADKGEFSERGYHDERFTRKNEIEKRTYLDQSSDNHYKYREQTTGNHYSNDQNANYNSREKKRSPGEKIGIILLVCLFGIPVILPVGIAILASMFGLLVGLFGVMIGLFAAAAAITIVGIVMLIVGIIELFVIPLAGLALCGGGLLLFGMGFLVSYGLIRLIAGAVPALVRGFVSICRMPFHRGGRTA